MRFIAIALAYLAAASEAAPAVARRKQDATTTDKTSLRGGGGGGGAVSSEVGRRELMMDHKNFSPLTCNANVEDSCMISEGVGATTTLSSILADSTASGTTATIPCGTCVTVDTTDGSPLSFPHGLNVEGMLHFPPESNVVIVTTHVFVQGVLKMDPPSGDNKVVVRLVGTDDAHLVPHPENSMACGEGGCNVGKKAIVVAGGRLDIRGLADPACPAWTKLQSYVNVDVDPGVQDGGTGCALDHDLLEAPDGTFESSVAGTSLGFFQHHSGGTFGVAVEESDGDVSDTGSNAYLAQSGRCCNFSGLGIRLDTSTCASVDANNRGAYRFSIRYRVNGGDPTKVNGAPSLQLQPQDGSAGCDHCRNLGRCSPGIDGEWVTCTRTITLSDREADAPSVNLVIDMKAHPSKSIDYDDVSFAAMPRPHDLEVGTAAASCWGARPDDNEVLITNSDSMGRWHGQTAARVASSDVGLGRIDLGRSGGGDLPPNPISAEEDADMASEVAWLSRAIVFEAEGDGPSDGNYPSLHGGHLIVLHTPGVAQHIEGVEIRNFGQQGNLGRYPIHFHMSSSVAGSVVRKNVIRESKQRCVVIHGSHDVLVEDNVSFDSYGHCYMLEDGGEERNTFRNNLGARTRKQGIGIGSSDHEPATLWITNPVNHFIGNVCAGSQKFGVWFELRAIRGASAGLPENENKKPGFLPLGTFKDNTAHSNGVIGMTTYAPGYRPPTEALFEGVKSYLNPTGLMFHGTKNIRVKDAFFGLNGLGVQYFANFGVNTFEDSAFVGSECGQEGIRFSFEARDTSQVEVSTTSFTGYTDHCASGSQSYALNLSSNQPKPGYDMPLLSSLTFDSNEVCALKISSPYEDKIVLAEDRYGTMNPSGSQGFFVNDAAHMTTFLDGSLCSSSGGSGLFCANTCLRRLTVSTGCCSQKHSPPDIDYQMVVTSKTDTSKSFVYDKPITKAGLWYFANQFDLVLPFDDYAVHFLSLDDGSIMVPPVTLAFRDESNLDDPPNCDHVTAASINFACPAGYKLSAADGMTCVELFELAEEIVRVCAEAELAIDSSECEGYCRDHACCFDESDNSCLEDEEKHCLAYAGCETLVAGSCTEDSMCTYTGTNPCEEGVCIIEAGECGVAPIEGCENGARLERWNGITGTSVNALTSNPRYPFSPDVTEILDTFLEAPTNIGDGYGQRLQTLITPPVTCDWNFYIASDDNSQLYLSTNNDPLNKVLVAHVSDWTHPKRWYKFPSQKGTVSLVKGQAYYLEAIHKEGGGGDNLAIGWECIEHGISLNVIGAEFTRLPEITVQP